MLTIDPGIDGDNWDVDKKTFAKYDIVVGKCGKQARMRGRNTGGGF